MSSAPHTDQEFKSRTAVISKILNGIKQGDTTVIEPFRSWLYYYGKQTYTPDLDQPIFVGFSELRSMIL